MRDYQAEEEGDYRRVSAGLIGNMSNAKWVRLFTSIAAVKTSPAFVQWRVLGTPKTFWERFPDESELREKEFSDGRFIRLGYRWIQSFHVPREYKPYRDRGLGYRVLQDVEELHNAITTVGVFDLVVDHHGLTLNAYSSAP